MDGGPLLSGIPSIESTALNTGYTIKRVAGDKWLRSDGECQLTGMAYVLQGTGSLESCPVGRSEA